MAPQAGPGICVALCRGKKKDRPGAGQVLLEVGMVLVLKGPLAKPRDSAAARRAFQRGFPQFFGAVLGLFPLPFEVAWV